VSWSEDFTQVNFQKIYSRFNIEGNKDNNLFWGYLISKITFWGSTYYGQLQTSNLLNITSAGADTKYIARFVGGSKVSDDGKNRGWYTDNDMKNNSDGSDLWAQMA